MTNSEQVVTAKPLLKWAGGKSQLLPVLSQRFPRGFWDGAMAYVEPFFGGGAVFFYVMSRVRPPAVLLSDLNPELFVLYTTVREQVDSVIVRLKEYESVYLGYTDSERKAYYYTIRGRLNQQLSVFDFEQMNEDWVERAAMLIFLNKTCYNGLFRVNKKGEFNTPAGRYRNPKICDEPNLLAVSSVLQRVDMRCQSFTQIVPWIRKCKYKSFVYCDPPYRPVSSSASFTAYSKGGFSDEQQLELAAVLTQLDAEGTLFLLSNSDSQDGFFDELYQDYYFEKVPARRAINSNAKLRGTVNEILVRNYPV